MKNFVIEYTTHNNNHINKIRIYAKNSNDAKQIFQSSFASSMIEVKEIYRIYPEKMEETYINLDGEMEYK